MDGGALQMQPLAWDGCFGWFHHSGGRPSREIAAIICPGIGRDSSTGYRPSRFLADRLAEAGYPTLRFSYPGTGDSRDLDDEPCWSAWARSVHAAIDMALAVSGARQVMLLGIRLGGALAACAASERAEVVGLVLLEPVLRGSSYVVQLRLEARIAAGAAGVEPDEVRLHGLRLSTESLNAIARVDLRTTVLSPPCRVLLLSDSQAGVLASCKNAWLGAGLQVAQESAAGLEAFFRPTHLADEPFPDVRRLLDWFGPPVSSSAARPAPRLVDEHYLALPGCVETPQIFGAQAHLFGMLCQPDRPTFPGRIVIIGNTGGDPHDGFARFGVELARALARRGIASLRMDFAGLGDSVNGAADRDGVTHTFEIDRRGDLSSAIDLVQGMGFDIVAVQGLCSGAYHALQAAVADERIAILLCVNLPWFNLRFEKAGATSFARRAVANLGERGVRSLFLYAAEDAGLKALQMHFGPHGRELSVLPGCGVGILPELDHDLTRPEMRRIVIGWIAAFLQDPVPMKETALSHLA
jgi:pimeloyl-ACP methyl ester carboxylesterase